MAVIFAGPYTTGNMDQPQWEEVESKLWADGVINGARNSFAVTLTSGLGVSVNTGDAVVDSFRFYSDTPVALTATAADPTNPRIDRVVLRVDGSGHTSAIVIKPGTPAPSPTPPALTQTIPAGTYEISLAQIRINAGAATIASLTDERVYTHPAIGPNAITSSQILSVLASQITPGNLNIGTGTLTTDNGNVATDGAGHFTKPLQTSLAGGAGGVTHADFKQTAGGGATLGEYGLLILHDGTFDIFDVTNGSTIMSGNKNAWTIFAPLTATLASISSDTGQITSDAAGNLTVSGSTGLILRNSGGSGVHGMHQLSGTGSVTATHGLNTTPNSVQVTTHAGTSTQSVGYDTEGATTVHVDAFSGLAWVGLASVHL